MNWKKWLSALFLAAVFIGGMLAVGFAMRNASHTFISVCTGVSVGLVAVQIVLNYAKMDSSKNKPKSDKAYGFSAVRKAVSLSYFYIFAFCAVLFIAGASAFALDNWLCIFTVVASITLLDILKGFFGSSYLPDGQYLSKTDFPVLHAIAERASDDKSHTNKLFGINGYDITVTLWGKARYIALGVHAAYLMSEKEIETLLRHKIVNATLRDTDELRYATQRELRWKLIMTPGVSAFPINKVCFGALYTGIDDRLTALISDYTPKTVIDEAQNGKELVNALAKSLTLKYYFELPLSRNCYAAFSEPPTTLFQFETDGFTEHFQANTEMYDLFLAKGIDDDGELTFKRYAEALNCEPKTDFTLKKTRECTAEIDKMIDVYNAEMFSRYSSGWSRNYKAEYLDCVKDIEGYSAKVTDTTKIAEAGYAYYRLNDGKNALKLFNRALKQDKTNDYVLLCKGLLLVCENDMNGADCLEEVLNLQSKYSPLAKENLASFYKRNGLTDSLKSLDKPRTKSEIN